MSTPNSLISCFVHTILRDSQNVHQNSLAFATSGHQARDVAGGAAGPSRLRRRAHWGCCCGGAAVLPSVTAHQRRCRVRRRARAASRDTLEGPGGWARHATRAVAGAGFPFTALARIFWQYVTKWFCLSNPSPLTDPIPSAAARVGRGAGALGARGAKKRRPRLGRGALQNFGGADIQNRQCHCRYRTRTLDRFALRTTPMTV